MSFLNSLVLSAPGCYWRLLKAIGDTWVVEALAGQQRPDTSRGVHIFYFQQQECYIMFTSESPYDLYIQYSCSLFF